MESLSTGAGLGAFGFWVFIAATVAAGVWDGIRKRDAQHETLRRILETDQPIDAELTDKLLQLVGGNRDVSRDMWIAGLVFLTLALALALFGWLLSIALAEALLPIMLSVAALLAAMGLGFLAISQLIMRRDAQALANQH